MKVLKILITLLVIGFLISCTTGKEGIRKQGAKEEVHKQLQPEYDKVFAKYPRHRIDDKIHKICIIGSGEGKNEITNSLTGYFIKRTDVKVVEAGNLQAILGGKIIEYGTGLGYSESQALSQMLQIDHILLFEEKISPHRDYQYGGKGSVAINLKIVNTLDGEVLYQSAYSFGVNLKDPRKYGYRMTEEIPPRIVDILRKACFVGLAYELSYAMGTFNLGLDLKGGGNMVTNMVVNSVADLAGIKISDKIVEINGKKVQSLFEMPREAIKQGDDIKIKVERQGSISEFVLKIPIIPFKPKEEGEKQEKKEKSKDKKIQL